ncbi:glycosyltransferase [Phytohabitans sp. LJ34]|uniref:glycosyltransferase n=1 Tax=Phytohabitans sp. LJ34 TaxID=3452217 RepID=UPI003F8C491E
MRRVLFVAEAVTLAHVTRSLALSRALDPAAYEVCHAWDPRYNGLTGAPPRAYLPIRTIPAARFARALARGTPLYRGSDLRRYVADDLALIERFRPDVVVGDFRLSLDVSARLAGVPYLAVTNAYWSPYARVLPPVPDITLTRLVGVRLAQRLFDRGREAVSRWHGGVFRELRRRHGLPPGPADVRDAYTRADTTLYADLPELVPVAGLPATHRFVGPVTWSPDLPCPPWWDGLPADRPVVYVTPGSSGRAPLLARVLRALAGLPVTVVAATAGRPAPPRVPANARVAAMLPAAKMLPRARLAIGNGGSPSAYQALAAGVPVLGICDNLDQYLNMSLVERAGAGWLLRGGRASGAAIRAAVRRALAAESARVRAGELATAIEKHDTPARFRAALEPVSGPA